MRLRAFRHAVVGLAALVPVTVHAASGPELIHLGRSYAGVYRPEGAKPPRVAVIYENGADSMGAFQCAELAKRGFLAICSSEPASLSNGAWEPIALDIKRDIEFARQQPGITAVVLYGHSGGGSIASFYQAVAENGLGFCQDSHKLSRCPDDLANLPKADAVVFPDAHPGTAVMNVRNLNPSISLKDGKIVVDPALDPFSPANGYAPGGKAHYSLAFQQRYFKAQAEAMNRLIAETQQKLGDLKAGRTNDPLAGYVVSPGLLRAARLEGLDPTIPGIMTSQQPRRLLHNDGTITVEKIRSVSVGDPAGGPAVVQTAPWFLSRSASLGKDSLDGLDYCSSNSNTVCNVQSIHAPSLFIAMGAGIFIGDEERMFERSAATDKEMIVVEGALHGGQTCKACETTPGQYAASSRNTYDYIAKWINARFDKTN